MATVATGALLWQRYQDWLYYHSGLGLYVDISRMRFDDALVSQLQPKFVKAFADMVALEAGAIANPDEQRMVGHYWLRNPDLAPSAEIKTEMIRNGVQSLRMAGIAKILAGMTTPEEILRCTVDD